MHVHFRTGSANSCGSLVSTLNDASTDSRDSNELIDGKTPFLEIGKQYVALGPRQRFDVTGPYGIKQGRCRLKRINILDSASRDNEIVIGNSTF